MIRRRVGVDDDIAEIALYLLEEAGESTAVRFIDGVELTLKELALARRRGIPKLFSDPALAEIRSWWVKGFPNHIIYYVPIPDGINVFAIWHGSRDVERRLKGRAP
jgi:plasmid stabilization system protein ParE